MIYNSWDNNTYLKNSCKIVSLGSTKEKSTDLSDFKHSKVCIEGIVVVTFLNIVDVLYNYDHS